MTDKVEVITTPVVPVVEPTPPAGNQGEKTFTQADMNAAIAERLGREGIKELKAKAAELDVLRQSQMTEIEKAKNETVRVSQELAVKNQQLAEIEIQRKKEELLEAEGLERSWAKRILGTTDEEIQADISSLKAELGVPVTQISRGSNPVTKQQQIAKGQMPTLNDLLHRAIGG